MDDFLVNELNIYDPEDKNFKDFKANGKLHGAAYSLS